MTIDIDSIDTKTLTLSPYFFSIAEFIKNRLDEGEIVTDEVVSWVINPLPVYAAAKSDEMEKIQRKHVERYYKKKESSIKLVRAIKAEFYSFLCTNSKEYDKERTQLGGNINAIITGLSSAIAAKLGGLEIGMVTSFVTIFFITVAKMGKNVVCKTYKPDVDDNKDE
jgi:hypothetical protein